MGLNRDFIGREFAPEVHVVDKYEVMAYASAIGAPYLNYLDDDSGANNITPPSFSVTYELPLIYKLLSDADLHGSKEQVKKNMLMLVHGDQQMNFYKPIMPGDKITCRAKISDIEDKGSGEIVKINMLSTFGDGTKMVESNWGLFIRGAGSGQRPARQKAASKKVAESRPVVFRKLIKMPQDITFRYSKASNDMNPIHIDDEVAKKAGLKGIIVHGLCTMAMTTQGIIEAYLNSDSSKLLSLGVRFSAPVYPGDELVVEGWENGGEDSMDLIGFEVTRKSDGVKVIKDATVRIRV